jgi:hypothetical protein
VHSCDHSRAVVGVVLIAAGVFLVVYSRVVLLVLSGGGRGDDGARGGVPCGM